MMRIPQLARDEDFFSGDTTVSDAFTDLTLIAYRSASIGAPQVIANELTIYPINNQLSAQ